MYYHMKRTANIQNIHDRVVRASKETYFELQKQGYIVSINPNGEKNQSVGSEQQCFPDVIVWKPSENDPSSGKAIIIEEIETEDSVNNDESEQWIEYSKLGVNKFILIVPQNTIQSTMNIIRTKQININEVWYYTFSGDRILFTKYFAL